MLATLVGLAVVAALGLIAYAAYRPDNFRIERVTTIRAKPETVYGLIEDFHQWTAWSPYENMDPDLKRTYGGAERGVGATYACEGLSALVMAMLPTPALRPSQA